MTETYAHASPALEEFVRLCLTDFPPETIGKLPRINCYENPKCTSKTTCSKHKKTTCAVCKQYITPAHTHIDFVGHAQLTARLLEVDPCWSWEPVAWTAEGAPLIKQRDKFATMWIRLTIRGVTRLGVGSVEMTKDDVEKELIGDCWASGTMITTARGQVPIENVVVGDLVLNSSGWRRVTDHWSNGMRECIEVSCNGVRLVGTPTHRVPTPNGVKALAEIRPGDPLWHDPSLLTQSSSSTTASSSTEGRAGGTTRTLPNRCSTDGSTRTTTAPSRMGGTSTTLTKTPRTTTQGILRPSPRRTMPASTGRSDRRGPYSAVAVALSSSLSSLGLDGVRPGVSRLSAGRTERSRNTPGFPPAASGVSTATLDSVPTSPGPAFAPLRVSSVRSGVVAEVWNLSVEGTHEYIANGVLSFNSLRNAAMRFGFALKLWAKGELTGDFGDGESEGGETEGEPPASEPAPAAARQAPPAKKAATAPRKAATAPPAKKATTPPPAKKAATTRPTRPAPAPAAEEPGLEDPVKLFAKIPKPKRQEAMAALADSPIESDEGMIALWPFPSDKTRGDDGEPISAETLEFALGEAVDALRAWAAEAGIEL